MKSTVLLLSFVLVVSYSHALSPPADPTEVKPSKLIRPFPPTRCGPICRMYCPNGFVRNSRGCPICKCRPGKCPRFTTLLSCRSCKFGRTYYTDRNGCRRCKCKTKPDICPSKPCMKKCTNGYQLDSRGCNTCTCKPRGGKSCRYNGRTHRHGQSYKKDCNTCFCRNGRSTCTKKACNTECPKLKCKACPLNLYRRNSKGCRTCRCRLPSFPRRPRRDIV